MEDRHIGAHSRISFAQVVELQKRDIVRWIAVGYLFIRDVSRDVIFLQVNRFTRGRRLIFLYVPGLGRSLDALYCVILS